MEIFFYPTKNFPSWGRENFCKEFLNFQLFIFVVTLFNFFYVFYVRKNWVSFMLLFHVCRIALFSPLYIHKQCLSNAPLYRPPVCPHLLSPPSVHPLSPTSLYSSTLPTRESRIGLTRPSSYVFFSSVKMHLALRSQKGITGS